MRRAMFSDWRAPATGSGHEGHWDAGISVEETDDGFVVLADLPGFDRDELSLRLRDDELHLTGEHDEETGTDIHIE